MKKLVIKFSEVWDKLKPVNMVVGNRFSTLRGYKPDKEIYYMENIVKEFTVMVKGKYVGKAILKVVGSSRLCEISMDTLKKDTMEHYNYIDVEKLFERMYRHPNPFLIYLVFEWSEVVR